MHELVVRGKNIDIRAYEIAGIDRIDGELKPQTLTLVRDGRALLGSIVDRCKRVDPADWIVGEAATSTWSSYLPFERAIDATMANLGSHQVVEEIAFIAHLELRQREERLERVKPSQGTTALLGECDSSLRRIRKALTAVDAAIAKVESVPPLLGFTSELHSSLAVRRVYAKFRSRVLAGGEPPPDSLRARLRGVGTQIAMLVGWDVYPELRVQDRLLLRDLQQRVLDWLRGSDATPASGLRLWQDLAGCVEMFALVNRRQELVEHDSTIIRTVLQRLEASEPSERVWQDIAALEGLDTELDQLLAQVPTGTADLRSIALRLAVQLGAAAAQTPSEVPW